jgi:hypothetical protein
MTKTTCFVPTLTCSLIAAVVGVAVAGAPDDGQPEAKKIAASLAKLPESDRVAAEAQRWCAVLEDNRLGSMDTPVKVTVDGKPVFLCCAGCKAKATANGPATLAKAGQLKKVNAAMAKLKAEDRKAAEAQRFCAVMEESRLGTMGVPVKTVIEGQPAFLCCMAFTDKALADPKTTLARVAKLKKAVADSE